MAKLLFVAAVFSAGVLGSCSKPEAPSSSSEPPAEKADAATPSAGGIVSQTAAMDACALLSKEEIASIQGEAPANTQLIGHTEGGLAVSQCNYLLPVGANSVSLRLVQRAAGPGARDPKQVWQDTFHATGPEAENAKKARQLQHVERVGEDAFWLGNRKTGGFHVLKGNSYIRITAGGDEDLDAKIAKCSTLAEFVLPRLPAEE